MNRSQFALFELRARRIRANLSPEQLGEKVGVDGSTIRNIEAGKGIRLSTAHKLAAFWKVDVLDLFPELAEPPSKSGKAA